MACVCNEHHRQASPKTILVTQLKYLACGVAVAIDVVEFPAMYSYMYFERTISAAAYVKFPFLSQLKICDFAWDTESDNIN